MGLANRISMQTPTAFKIFLVDDDLFSLHLYEQNLKTLGQEDVHLMSTATECLERLVEKPQIIFLDHHLEDLNGFEVLKKIKRFDPNMYVVMVSGQKDMQIALDSLRFGAFDYLIKGEGELEKMGQMIKKIGQIREMLLQKNPPFFKKVLSFLLF